MTKMIDIPGGSYFQAASLKAQFNVRHPKETEPQEVSAILKDAVELVTSTVSHVMLGYELKKCESYAYIGPRETTLLSQPTAAVIATAPQPGDSAGMVKVAVTEGTEKQLNNISRAFNLGSITEAARLAMTVYTRLQQVSGQYGKVYLERGADTVPFKPTL